MTSDDAVKKRASGPASHAGERRAGAMWVLPHPTSPMGTRSSRRSGNSGEVGDSRPIPSGRETAGQSWPPRVLGAGRAQRPGRAARLEASRLARSASGWPARYPTRLGVPSPDRSPSTAVVSERAPPASTAPRASASPAAIRRRPREPVARGEVGAPPPRRRRSSWRARRRWRRRARGRPRRPRAPPRTPPRTPTRRSPSLSTSGSACGRPRPSGRWPRPGRAACRA